MSVDRFADLHCHTELSDGSTSVRDVVELAAKSGLNTLAITDHDTMAGCAEARAIGEKLGIRVIPGVEISSVDPSSGRKVHILCYAPERPELLKPMLDASLENRNRAMRESIEIVEQLYPISSKMMLRHAENSTCIYKQHVMQTLMEAGFADEIFGELFKKLFSSRDGIAFRRVEYPDVYEALKTAIAAGGAVVMAHPSEYDGMELLKELCSMGMLDGIEISHPRNREEDKRVMHELARKYDLAVTGGTDFHGWYTTKKNPVGAYTTAEAEFDKLFKRKGSINYDL